MYYHRHFRQTYITVPLGYISVVVLLLQDQNEFHSNYG